MSDRTAVQTKATTAGNTADGIPPTAASTSVVATDSNTVDKKKDISVTEAEPIKKNDTATRKTQRSWWNAVHESKILHQSGFYREDSDSLI